MIYNDRLTTNNNLLRQILEAINNLPSSGGESTPTVNKNLLGVNNCSITAKGITLTVEDGVFVLNGTNDGTGVSELSFQSYLQSPMLEAGQYHLMRETISGTFSESSIQYQYATGIANVNINIPTQSSTLQTFTQAQNRAKIVCQNGSSFNNFTFHFWISKDEEIPYIKYEG